MSLISSAELAASASDSKEPGCEPSRSARSILLPAASSPSIGLGVRLDGDIREREFVKGEADIIVGGFPCQDVSLAGKRAGVAGIRSELYREVLRAVRVVRPIFAVMENVAALLGFGMGVVLGDVAEDGLDAEWDCLSAGERGAPHGRDRVWITLADPDQLQRPERRTTGAGWWLWRQEEVEAARNANGDWQLECPRLLGDIRRRADDAARSGTLWAHNWQEKFEALRGMDDGVPTRLDRSAIASGIKTLGNAVVPQIPQIIGEAIMAHHNSQV